MATKMETNQDFRSSQCRRFRGNNVAAWSWLIGLTRVKSNQHALHLREESFGLKCPQVRHTRTCSN